MAIATLHSSQIDQIRATCHVIDSCKAYAEHQRDVFPPSRCKQCYCKCHLQRPELVSVLARGCRGGCSGHISASTWLDYPAPLFPGSASTLLYRTTASWEHCWRRRVAPAISSLWRKSSRISWFRAIVCSIDILTAVSLTFVSITSISFACGYTHVGVVNCLQHEALYIFADSIPHVIPTRVQ